MRILVDMDNTLTDCVHKWLDAYHLHTGERYKVEQIVNYGWLHQNVKKPDLLHSIMDAPKFFDHLEPLPGAIDGFHALSELGHEVLVCTKPYNAQSARAKIDWCSKHLGTAVRDVIQIAEKSMVKADLLIDDSPAQLYAFTAEGGEAITIRWPWTAALEAEIIEELQPFVCGEWTDTERAWQAIVEQVEEMQWQE